MYVPSKNMNLTLKVNKEKLTFEADVTMTCGWCDPQRQQRQHVD